MEIPQDNIQSELKVVLSVNSVKMSQDDVSKCDLQVLNINFLKKP